MRIEFIPSPYQCLERNFEKQLLDPATSPNPCSTSLQWSIVVEYTPYRRPVPSNGTYADYTNACHRRSIGARCGSFSSMARDPLILQMQMRLFNYCIRKSHEYRVMKYQQLQI
uniref:Uncharacterized protein n=1 Tax=Pectinophora gossypiella TaxID=13191 RepID=A0A1E1VZR3_PECGO